MEGSTHPPHLQMVSDVINMNNISMLVFLVWFIASFMYSHVCMSSAEVDSKLYPTKLSAYVVHRSPRVKKALV